MEFHPEVDRALRSAGWQPGRRVPELVTKWRLALESGSRFTLHQAAESVLIEFGGLRIERVGTGVEVSSLRVDLDPAVALGEDDRLLDYFPELHNRSVFPLGEVEGGHAFLGIDLTGVTYLVMDEVHGRWPSFPLALDGVLRGVRAPQLGRPPNGAV
jgi:SUKH-3 immunity protein of toxin-antitoxin system